jgi:hypothetical protein
MVFLKAIKRTLEQAFRRLDQLLKQAKPPKLGRRGEVAPRVQEILGGIRKKGGRVTKQELSDIVASAGMIVTAVGSLYQAGYLKQDLKDKGYVVLGPRARSAAARVQSRKST